MSDQEDDAPRGKYAQPKFRGMGISYKRGEFPDRTEVKDCCAVF